MKTRKTLWFTLFIVCSLTLVSGSSGVFAVETGSEIDSAAPVATAPEEARTLLDDPSVRGRTPGTFETRLRILGSQVEAPAGATTELGAGPAARGLLQSTDVQVNWSGGDVYPDTTQSETSIRVNPNTGTICVAYNDSQTGTGYSRSTDGGTTFVDGGGFPEGPGTQKAGADPSLEWRSKDGFFYYAAINDPGALSLWRSTDDCETFSYYKELPIADREMMVIDNNPANPDYYGRFYITYGPGIMFTYSDDGITWADPVDLSPGGNTLAPWPAVDPVTADVYVAWRRWHTGYTGPMDIEIARSTNGGATWDFVTNPLTAATNPYDPDASLNCGGFPALNGDIKVYSVPQIVVDRYSNLHVVYSRDPDGAGFGDVTNVYYRRSTTQGSFWGPEVLLNDDATLTDQWFPTVSVGPTGTVVATWYDRCNDPDNNFEYDYYMAISLDNGVTWGPNIRVSDVSSSLSPPEDCYHGDYDQQVQQGAFVYITWSDDRNIPLGFPDPDVWFDKALVTPQTIYLPLIQRSN